jgi:hypothetical protein
MAVPVVNIVIEQGVDYEDIFLIKDPDGSFIDLTGQTAFASIKKHPTSEVTVPFESLINVFEGTVTLSMACTLTDTLDEGRYYYDVILTSSSNKKEKVISGMVLVNPSITV